jgi:hypothetical protein
MTPSPHEPPFWTGWHELRTFDIDAPQLALRELGTHLRSHYIDIRHLSPRRLEELVADAFREHGLTLELTRATRDGGFDLLVFTEGNRIASIVEVKHWRNAVGVEEVRKLRAVQVRDDVCEAVLVTSGRFTRDARSESIAPHPISLGYRMTLMDAHDLLGLLQVYTDGGRVLPGEVIGNPSVPSVGCPDEPPTRPRHSGQRCLPAGTEVALKGHIGLVVGRTRSGRRARIRWRNGPLSLHDEPVWP